MPVVTIAHRGASGYAPEHTVAAYDLALQMGTDYIEQDLQMTADGVLVVMHDETLDRTTDCGGLVSDRTLEQLKGCDAGSWFNESHPEEAKQEFAGLAVPTLEEVFARYGAETRYYIEPKRPGMEEELLRLIAAFGLRDAAVAHRAVLIQSFNETLLRTVRAMDPELPLIQLGPVDPSACVAVADYAVGIGPPHWFATEELVAAAHAHGLVVHPYTANSPDDIERLLALGVDGMFTDFPNLL